MRIETCRVGGYAKVRNKETYFLNMNTTVEKCKQVIYEYCYLEVP